MAGRSGGQVSPKRTSRAGLRLTAVKTQISRADLVEPGHESVASIGRSMGGATQQRRQAPHETQQPPQPPQPPQRQPRQRHPRQPRQPPQPRHAVCTLASAFSLSNRWNVDSDMSAISSSLSVIGWVADKSTVFGASAAGIVAADAAPTMEKPNPAAPSAGTAALTARFRFEAGFACGIVKSPIPSKGLCRSAPP